mgnify:CR=1 FL=1
MKRKTILILVVTLMLAFLLSACSGSSSSAAKSWAGVLLTDDTIFYSNSTFVYALKTENGNILWSYPEKASPSRIFSAEPVLAGDQLIVGDYGKLLTSLNVLDGKEKWQFGGAKSRYVDSPLVINDMILAPNADYHLYALDLQGNLKWTFTAGHSLWTRPASDGKFVYVACLDHNLYALDLVTGSLVWKTDLGASLVSRPVLSEDGTLVFQGNIDGTMVALSTSDGSKVWEQKAGGPIWSAPVVYSGNLYFGDESGRINILLARDGSVVQSLQTDGAVLGGGTILETGIAFGNEKGEVILVGFNGEKQWTRTVNGKLYSNLHSNGSRLIVSAYGGEKPLVALDVNGNENWYFAGK